MVELNITLVIQVVNFLVALFVIHFLIIKPIRTILKQRSNVTHSLASQAESTRQDAERRLAGYEAQLEQVRVKAAIQKHTFRQQGQERATELLFKAQQDASVALTNARQGIAQEYDATLLGLRAKVDGLAGKVVEKLTH